MVDTFVVVCGLPSSGNRAMKKLLKQCSHMHRKIIHGHETDMPVLDDYARRYGGENVYYVMMVRSPKVQFRSRLSKEHDGHPEEWYADYFSRCTDRLIGKIAEHGSHLIAISYEGLVEDPGGVAEYLCARIPGTSIRESNFSWVIDGNQKWRDNWDSQGGGLV